MALDIIIGLITMLIALNGLTFQPKRDPDGPTNWKNINSYGRILFGLVILLTLLNIAESYYDEANHSKEVNQLLASQDELKETNRHLIKVMSVADGYNAVIRGTVFFDNPVDDNEIRAALNNLFLKFVRIDLRAVNKFGIYTGRIDYAAHPEVRKYLRLPDIPAHSIFSRFKELEDSNSYIFEIRCSKLKILNFENIQYARLGGNQESLEAHAKSFEWSGDFNRIYHIRAIYLEELEIEELEEVRMDQWLGLKDVGGHGALWEILWSLKIANDSVEQAVRSFEMALLQYPRSSANRLGYEEALYQSQRYKEALSAAQHVSVFVTDSIKVLRIIADSHALLGHDKEALSAYLRLSKLDSMKYEKEIQALSRK